jgi:hypothetical protein
VKNYYYWDAWKTYQDHTAAFTYDGVNRLVTAVATLYGSGTIGYNLTFNDSGKGKGYDAYGNMTCVLESNTNGPCPNWSFSSSANQLNTSQGFAYDASGNMTTDNSGSVGPYTRNYTWDAEGRLTQVTDHNGGATTTGYMYDALG